MASVQSAIALSCSPFWHRRRPRLSYASAYSGLRRMASVTVRNHFVGFALATVGDTAAIVCLGVVGSEADGLGAVRNQFVILSLVPVASATIVVCLGQVGFKPDRLGAVRNLLVVLALVPVGETAIAVCLGEVGLEADGLVVVPDRLIRSQVPRRRRRHGCSRLWGNRV